MPSMHHRPLGQQTGIPRCPLPARAATFFGKTCLGIVFLFILLSGAAETRAESFYIQMGFYKNFENAKAQYTSIYNVLTERQRGDLRIEKSGALYAVRIGRFDAKSQAEALLPLVRPVSPGAFIRKGAPNPRDIVLRPGKPPAFSPVPTSGKETPDPGSVKSEGTPSGQTIKPTPAEEVRPPSASAPQDQIASIEKADRPSPYPAETRGALIQPPARRTSPLSIDISKEGTASPPAKDAIPANRAWLTGTVRDAASLPPQQLGLKPGKEIFRLILQVEDTRPVAGYTNLMTEKQGDLITVFTENAQPFLKPGAKIKALVEYRGSQYSRFFWIVKTEPLTR